MKYTKELRSICKTLTPFNFDLPCDNLWKIKSYYISEDWQINDKFMGYWLYNKDKSRCHLVIEEINGNIGKTEKDIEELIKNIKEKKND